MDDPVVPDNRLVLVTGASGYVGGRLLRELERREHRARCLVRRPEFVSHRSLHPRKSLRVMFLIQPPSIAPWQASTLHIFWFIPWLHRVHLKKMTALQQKTLPAPLKSRGCSALSIWAARAGQGLSPHRSSRKEVGAILRQSKVPAIEFRASVILGSGSLSFELVRALVESCPL